MIESIISSKYNVLTHSLLKYQIYKLKKMNYKLQNYPVNNDRKIKEVCFQNMENKSQVK